MKSPTLSMKKLSEKLSSVSLKSKIQPLVENDAFEGIGDEDLWITHPTLLCSSFAFSNVMTKPIYYNQCALIWKDMYY